MQAYSMFSPPSSHQGQYSSHCTYGQSSGVYHYEQSPLFSGPPSTRVDQRQSPTSGVFFSPRASPVSHAEPFSRNSPTTPPMVILNTVNNYFTSSTPPESRPRSDEAWRVRRHSPAYHNLPLDHNSMTSRMHHPATSPRLYYDSRGWDNSYLSHQEGYGQHYFVAGGPNNESTRPHAQPVSYVPSLTTMPSFGQRSKRVRACCRVLTSTRRGNWLCYTSPGKESAP
ncbi:hypothetical protein J3A83DRAFT_2622517 [Scleroderma citrinum]